MNIPDEKRLLNANENSLTKDASSSELLEQAKVVRKKQTFSSAPLDCVHRGTRHRGHALFFIKIPDYLEHIPVCVHHKDILIREAESLGIQATEESTPDYSFVGGVNYTFYPIVDHASAYRAFKYNRTQS